MKRKTKIKEIKIPELEVWEIWDEYEPVYPLVEGQKIIASITGSKYHIIANTNDFEKLTCVERVEAMVSAMEYKESLADCLEILENVLQSHSEKMSFREHDTIQEKIKQINGFLNRTNV